MVEVTGDSMSPALLPGDWLVVERWSLSRRAPLPREIVLAADPRSPSRELVKRVADVRDGSVMLRGDNSGFSTDSSAFGAVPAKAVVWRVVGRYWPPRRARRLVPAS